MLVFIDRKCPDCDGSGLVFRKNAKWGNACQTCNGMGSIGECREATPEEMKSYEPTEFGNWLRTMRIKYEVTYSRLAELTGLRISRLSEIERGKGEPAADEEKAAIRAHLRGIAIDLRYAEALRLEKVRGAAEDMLAALKLFIAAGLGNSTDFQKQSVASKAAISAIAKAEGRK